MRPVSLEMEGFSTFRNRTEVDFRDVELFALVGPTGSGKSSVIDAMVFALYGIVPRYDDKRLVWPVIHQNAVEARVRFTFEVNGVEHDATRVVRRQKKGAKTVEARLQRGDDVLADGNSVDTEVERLLGLSYDEFTKCVVLPQGAFAALLHEKPAGRNSLLEKLLDLGVYELVAKAAGRARRDAEVECEKLAGRLDELPDASDERLAAVEARRSALEALAADVRQAADELVALRSSVDTAAAEHAAAERDLRLLEAIEVPEGIDALQSELVAAVTARAAAEEHAETTASAAAEAEAALEGRRNEAEITRLVDLHRRVAEFDDRLAKGQALIAAHALERSGLLRAAEAADEAVTTAEHALREAQIHDAAADLARSLAPGDDCPVCGQVIGEIPEADAGAIEVAEREVAEARRSAKTAAAAVAEHEKKAASYQERLDGLVAEKERASVQLGEAPPLADLETELDGLRRLLEAARLARSADVEARGAADKARADERAIEATARDARGALQAARDSVAALGPVALGGDDLVADWKALHAWAGEQAAAATQRVAAATEVARDAKKLLDEQAAGITTLLTDAGLPTAGAERASEAVAAAMATVQRDHEQILQTRQRSEALRADRAVADERRQVHELLERELGARRFRAWLLDEALDLLLSGATETLRSLSSGRYSLTKTEGDEFAVIDHHNADEHRLAKTLSGGETFLASLALALSLTERISEVAGGASLDTILLDEGFGTLDPETLDVVATAIEELSTTKGRMVGVISHVRDLAERVPVRYEVRKGPETSTVTREDQ